MSAIAKKMYLISEIDNLPEEVLGEIIDYVGYIKLKKGMYENDTEYLESIPGMIESIKEGMKEKVSDCVDSE